MAEQYFYDLGSRARQVTWHAILTSSVVIMVMMIGLALGVVAWSLGALGLALLLGGVGSAALLLFVYGSTFFPALPAPKTVTALARAAAQGERVNVADAVSFGLAQLPTPLDQTVDALWKTAPARALLQRLSINEEESLATIEKLVVPQMTTAALAEALWRGGRDTQAETLMLEHLVGAWLLHPALRSYLREGQLRESDVLFGVWWMTTYRRYRQAAARWWDENTLLQFSGVGLSWASGFTPLIDQLSYFPRGNLWDDLALGRDAQVEQLINTLARQRQANVLLVGQPGVGQLGIVKEVQRRIVARRAHPALNDERMMYVHVGQLVAQSATSSGQVAIVSRALNEMERAGNIIAVFDGLGSILGESGEQRINLTEILLPFFSSLSVRVVVMVSSDEYHLRLVDNPELIHLFEVVQVESLSEDDTMKMLALQAPPLERQSGVYLPYQTLQALVSGTSSILPHIPFPERAFDFLAEALVMAQGKGWRRLEPSHINQLIAQKVGVSVGALSDDERQRLLNLESIMHERIVNQSIAVSAVARAMIRARVGVRSVQRPIGTFLFLGPTGVGKTETAKTLAAAYFGREDTMQRLDMSEFTGSDAVARLIGSTTHPNGRLTALIEDHPFSVVLLDEFEKASPDVHQLFLQVFDEGHLTDARGQTVSFKHTIMIATSNAGAEFIREQVHRGPLPENFSDQLREYLLRGALFRPELLNRFDGVITFTPLNPDHIRQVATIMLKNLNKRLDKKQGVTVALTPALVDFLVEIGYNPEFGARPMARAIQDTVEYVIADGVVRGAYAPGQEVVLDPNYLRATRLKY